VIVVIGQNLINESSITQGVNVFRFDGSATAGAIRLPHLNPLTQEFTIHEDRELGG